MGSEMQVNIFSIFSLGKDRSYLFPADIMTLGDVIGFHVFIRFSCLLYIYSFCHVRSLMFKFLIYTMVINTITHLILELHIICPS